MKKNDFVFLISYASPSGVHIRRIEISKKKIRKGLLGSVFCFFVLAVFEFSSFNLDKVFSQVGTGKSLVNSVFAENRSSLLQMQLSQAEIRQKEAINAGGPIVAEDSDLDKNNAEVTTEIDEQLKEITSILDSEAIPNIWPREDKINNEFGFRNNPFGGRTYEFHEGIDIGGERGDKVIAAGSGRVIKAGWQGGYGNLIEIDHGNGLTTRYGHLMKIEVEVGDFVSKGQQIGLVGSTGRSTGPHLHFELRLNDKAINPRKLLPPEPTVIQTKSQPRELGLE
jgi:murein DD-endopeptidase MepM/ murein hydrolase activator NlpD